MLQKVTGAKLNEQVVEQIKSLVAEGIYKKGDMLPSEAELMSLTGVSRITVREALKKLAEVGLIETKRGKGSFVIIDSNELQEPSSKVEDRDNYKKNFQWSSDARMILEPEIARQAALQATEEDIVELEKYLFNKNKKGIYTEAVFDGFHRKLVEITKNQLLLEFFDHLFEIEDSKHLSVILLPPDKQKIVSKTLHEQHCRIFETIKRHDGEFAYFYMKEHLRYTKEEYANYFKLFL